MRPVLAALLAAALVGTSATSAAPPKASGAATKAKLSGRLADDSYDLLYLARNGRVNAIRIGSGGRFSATVKSPAGASLHLTKDGRYAGPVLLPKKRVALAAASRVNVGTVKPRAGYATISGRPKTSGRAIRTNAKGKPVGAGRLGMVRLAKARAAQAGAPTTEGADTDRDGVANAFDADNDGDLILDNIEGQQPSGVSLHLSSALPLGLAQSINANAGASGDVEATLVKYLRFLFGVSADEVGEVDRVGVSCTFAWCRQALVVTQPGLGESNVPWADGDGDGLLDLVREGPAYNRQIYPRAGAGQVRPGDTFTATASNGISAATALSFYFTRNVAVQTLGSHAFVYPVKEGDAGTPGHPVTIPGQVKVTFWRPQRAAIPGAETAPQLDIGGLLYGVDVNGAACRPGDFSGLSETLTKLEDRGGQEAALRDSAPDAPPAGATMSLTVDAAACAARGGDTGGGFGLLSVLASDEFGDLTRQHIVVQFG